MERELTLVDKIHEIKTRHSGRTTSKIHYYIATLLSEPNREICVTDHYHTVEADIYLAERLMEVVNKLGYNGFSIRIDRRRNRAYATYDDSWRKKQMQELAKRMGVNKDLLKQAKELGIDLRNIL